MTDTLQKYLRQKEKNKPLTGYCSPLVKLKKVFLRESQEETDELSLVTAHFDPMAARKATKDGAKHYKEFFDHLADGIIEFRCRLLTIDANMSVGGRP